MLVRNVLEGLDDISQTLVTLVIQSMILCISVVYQ